MVVTRTCARCGDELVIEATVVGATKPILIGAYPTAFGPAEGDGSLDFNGCTVDECVAAIYGLIAVPEDVTRPAWVVSQYTPLGKLIGHKLHHVHVCLDQVEAREREQVAA